MNIKFSLIVLCTTVSTASLSLQTVAQVLPWTTIEAESMHTTGTVLGPAYEPYRVETESSGQRCVKLATSGAFVEFKSPIQANSLVVRYSLPDKKEGCTLAIYKNGSLVRRQPISSRYRWLYGKYPFTNDPAAGSPRNFYDELRLKDPTTYTKQQFPSGHNLITQCTVQLPFLANGAAIYGGESNAIRNCTFQDISAGSAILISTTFPTANANTDNNFSGTTVVEDCTIKTSGGFDHEWGWRAAVEICVDKRNITGLNIANLNIIKSLSNAVSIIAKNELGALSHASLTNSNISGYGIGTKDKHALFVSKDAHGSLTIPGKGIADTRNESTNFTLQQ